MMRVGPDGKGLVVSGLAQAPWKVCERGRGRLRGGVSKLMTW